MELKISKAFKELFTTDKNEILLSGGRASGKTKISTILAVLLLIQNKKCDGIIARASYGSLGTSSYNEFVNQINEMGDEVSSMFTFKKSPLRIIKNDGSTIYFMGYGGSNMSRTKGIKPLNKVGFVIFEETQELPNKENLDQAKASFRRTYGNDVKQFVIFNPPPMKAHWINLYAEECKKDSRMLVLHTTYKDIWEFLNDFDRRDIIKEKILNYENYRYLYLGIPTGGQGVVYPMLKERILISRQEFDTIRLVGGLNIVACVIGVDGAVTHDCTCCCPMLILNNGQVVIGRCFYHNPLTDNIIGSHKLVQDYISKWFKEIRNEYALDVFNVPIYIRCDNSATDLIQELNFFLGDRANVSKIQKGSIVEMVSNVQSALSNDMVYIIEENQHFNYVANRNVHDDINILWKQLSLLVRNEQQTNYDPSVPNDMADSFTYACRFYFSNIENISWFNILKSKNLEYTKINEIIGR